MKNQKRYFLLFLLTFLCSAKVIFAQNSKTAVLVFSKTAAFRHQSIEAGNVALKKMAEEKGFDISFTEDANLITESNLKNYNTVIFLNTTGNIFNEEQQSTFERYIQAGGGYVGIHAATDTEYDWPWYNKLAGAWFLDHPMTPSNVQNGRFFVTERNEFTEGMPDSFEREDEFYSFKDISSNINVVLKIDETTYIGGKNGDNHPISWYQEFDGGRSFYTAMGHTDETFKEALFLNHLWAGIKYTSEGVPVDFSKSRPEENRFTKVVLKDKLDEPMELTLLDKDRVLFIQRKGEVRLYNDLTKELKTIAIIPVSNNYVNAEGTESMGEDGLLGLNKDPNFNDNQWVYMYYSSTKGSYNQLSRFTMDGDELLLDSEIEMLSVETQREECCHTGGSIAWDKSGNLYLSTGDNTNPHGSNGYSPSDERSGRSAWDAQKSSANTNDLRGKIMRITPQADGSYTIPEGNLFAKGTEGTRPEIYTMGHRNPYRISVDQKNGNLYWGEVGPDAAKADSLRGPAGQDEVGQAREAGNYGWPHFVGDNKAYNKYDFVNEKSRELWDENAPSNTSPNNTGLEILPPAQKAFIWYPYGDSPEFPLVGGGGRNAMAGPIFYSDRFKDSERAFPAYYDGKFIQYEWMRGWIMAVTMDEEGNYVSMEKFMPSYRFSNPMDMEFADNGDLYMLEYGSGWFTANDDARLIRIEYNGGNRKPQIQMTANQMGGAAPFELELSSEGTFDADNNELKYTWKITSESGFSKVVNTPDVNLTLDEIGNYNVLLTVDDGEGSINSQSMEIIVGNEPPVLSLEMPNSNNSFYVANRSFEYEIKVNDKEDGALNEGIDAENVAVSIDYMAEGFDKVAIAQGHRSADAGAAFTEGRKLIAGSDCLACHSENKKSIGPTYNAIAEKYKGDNGAIENLTKKVISGGSGVWGEVPMAGHPSLSTDEASEMVNYILNLSNEKPKEKTLPVNGTFTAKAPASDKNLGVYIVRAAYEDQGANGMPSLKSEQTFVLRNSKVGAHGFDEYVDINKMAFGGNDLAIPAKNGAYMTLNQVDLNGIKSLQVMATAPKPQLNAVGGKVELRLSSPNGALLGISDFLEPTDKMDFTPVILNIPVKQTSNSTQGLQDIYVVFVNPDAGGQSMMVVMGFEFKMLNEGEEPEINNSEASSGDYEGTWLTTFIGIPTGDAEMILDLKRVDGVLTGSIKPNEEGEVAVALDKIEESPDKIVLHFSYSSYNVNVSLSRDDNDNLSGTLMGMFKAKAVRIKNDDYFAGNWEITIFETPNGDAVLNTNLTRTDGVLSGTLKSKDDPSINIPIIDIEEEEESIKLSFSAQGMDIWVLLKKEDKNSMKGNVLDMFDASAVRVE